MTKLVHDQVDLSLFNEAAELIVAQTAAGPYGGRGWAQEQAWQVLILKGPGLLNDGASGEVRAKMRRWAYDKIYVS